MRSTSCSGIFCSRWMGSYAAVMPYVTCGSKKVAWSAAMTKSASPST
jgi:hypothetical protein